jgi:hypothetical protein
MPTPTPEMAHANAGVAIGRYCAQPARQVSAGMLSAYVLIATEVGKANQVTQAIRGVDGVQRAEDVTGPTTSSPESGRGLDQLGRRWSLAPWS